MSSVTPFPPQKALLEVHEEAKKLAGKGKIQYTHVLDAFRRVYKDNPAFQGAFERQMPISTDLERAEALATLVEKAAEGPTHESEHRVALQEVGGALRRWTYLERETKGKIDRVIQSTLPKRRNRIADVIKEFFYDLGAKMSRLSSLGDKNFADQVCKKMEKGLEGGSDLENVDLPMPGNRVQRTFLESAKELYRQRIPEAKVESAEQRKTKEIKALGTYDLKKVTLEEIERRISFLKMRRSESDTTEKHRSLIDETLSEMYYHIFIKNTSAEKTGDDAARAEVRGNVRAALMRLRDEVGADSPVGQDITKKLEAISGMEEHETRLREQKKSQ
jgi:hypothetical protein